MLATVNIFLGDYTCVLNLFLNKNDGFFQQRNQLMNQALKEQTFKPAQTSCSLTRPSTGNTGFYSPSNSVSVCLIPCHFVLVQFH